MRTRIRRLYGIQVKNPEKFQEQLRRFNFGYRNNYEFVAMIALTYRLAGKHSISPREFYREILGYNIKTLKGKEYVPNSRGPFNLIRAAWLYFRKAYGDFIEIEYTRKPVCLSNVILDMYVNKDSKHAWEVPHICKSFK